jgi:hypothetical protein
LKQNLLLVKGKEKNLLKIQPLPTALRMQAIRSKHLRNIYVTVPPLSGIAFHVHISSSRLSWPAEIRGRGNFPFAAVEKIEFATVASLKRLFQTGISLRLWASAVGQLKRTDFYACTIYTYAHVVFLFGHLPLANSNAKSFTHSNRT